MDLNLKAFYGYSEKKRSPEKLHSTFFSPEKSTQLLLSKDVEPSHERKMVKLLTCGSLFPPKLTRFRFFTRALTLVLGPVYMEVGHPRYVR